MHNIGITVEMGNKKGNKHFHKHQAFDVFPLDQAFSF